MSVATITPKQLFELSNGGKSVELIDVRTPAEFQEVHVSFARNFPLEQFDCDKVQDSRTFKTEPLYVICRAGGRGNQACEKLIAAGCTNVVNVEGGTLAWDQAGYPVIRGRKVMSLERQVRIAAGSLVLTGIGLSFLHPWLLGISAFIGAGLVFAGITDTCGMGMILARMPWNQTAKA